MFPMDHRPLAVTLEYDCHGQRARKTYPTEWAAKSAYVALAKQGRSPAVVRSDTMTPEVTPVVETEPKAASKPQAAPKSKAAPKAKPSAKPSAKAQAKAKKPAKAKGTAQGTHRDHDVAWGPKKVAIFKALKSLGATSSQTAQPTVAVATKAGVRGQEVRHYVYHAMAAGLCGVSEESDGHGYGFYLTAKGAKLDPVAEFKAQKAAKE